MVYVGGFDGKKSDYLSHDSQGLSFRFSSLGPSVPEPFRRDYCFLFQILNSITEEVLEHIGTFRSPLDQLEFIIKRFKEGKMTNYIHKNVRVYILLGQPGHFLSS